jgi:hypothetical protein
VLVPKLVTTLRTYDRQQLSADLTAGVIVALRALRGNSLGVQRP